jgi:outer membrane protein OmpA-like peptidoglycan-associated protein
MLGEAPGGNLAPGVTLVPGGDCPATAMTAADLAALGAGAVPVKPGLTLTEVWVPAPGEEYECLTQVTAVTVAGIDATVSCDHPRRLRDYRRRLCLADLESAGVLVTQIGAVTVLDAGGEELPETVVGAGWISLSKREFAELKRTGSVPHHYAQPRPGSATALVAEAVATLRRGPTAAATIAVNDRLVEIPVVSAEGEARFQAHGRSERGRVTALILDDERLPLLVDYAHVRDGASAPTFRLSVAKISYPGADSAKDGEPATLERRLAARESVDVYGIYFAFDSARIRRESEPVLAEIADLLRRHGDWRLRIAGHTDGVGGDAYNVELSRRRSEAVRAALVERFGIAAKRLSTDGHGAGAPKDRNDTPEGRARNRRVELTRY